MLGQRRIRSSAWVKHAAIAAFCAGLLAVDSGGQAQSSATPSVVVTWTCEYTGARRSEASVPGKTLAQKQHRVAKRWIAQLKNKDGVVRKNAAVALGELKTPEAILPLVNALKDNEQIVSACASASLVSFGAAAVKPVTELLKDKNPFVPALAALTLNGIRDARARAALLDALQAHNSAAILGVHTLFVRLGVPGSEPALADTLAKFPSREIAEEYYNSGNSELEAAARSWANRYGQRLRLNPYGDPVAWGSGAPTPLAVASNANLGSPQLSDPVIKIPANGQAAGNPPAVDSPQVNSSAVDEPANNISFGAPTPPPPETRASALKASEPAAPPIHKLTPDEAVDQ